MQEIEVKKVIATQFGYSKIITNDSDERCDNTFDYLEKEITKNGGHYDIFYVGYETETVLSPEHMTELYESFDIKYDYVYDSFEDEFYCKALFLIEPIKIKVNLLEK